MPFSCERKSHQNLLASGIYYDSLIVVLIPDEVRTYPDDSLPVFKLSDGELVHHYNLGNVYPIPGVLSISYNVIVFDYHITTLQ